MHEAHIKRIDARISAVTNEVGRTFGQLTQGPQTGYTINTLIVDEGGWTIELKHPDIDKYMVLWYISAYGLNAQYGHLAATRDIEGG